MTPDECCQAAQAANPTPDWCPEEVPRTTVLSAAHPWLADRGQPAPDPADEGAQLLVHPMHGGPSHLWQVVHLDRSPDGSGNMTFSHLSLERVGEVVHVLVSGPWDDHLPDPDHLRAWSDFNRQVIVQTLHAHGLYQEADLL